MSAEKWVTNNFFKLILYLQQKNYLIQITERKYSKLQEKIIFLHLTKYGMYKYTVISFYTQGIWPIKIEHTKNRYF